MILVLLQFLPAPARSFTFRQERCDQKRLQHQESDRGDYPPLVLLPDCEFAESDDAVWWQKIFINAPTLELTPVKHWYNWRVLDGDVRRRGSVCHLQHHLGHSSRICLHGPDIDTNDYEND